LVAQQGTIAVLNGIGASVYLRNARGWWVGWHTAANYVSYSWRVQVGAMSAFVMVELDVLIVGAVLPLSQVALYSIAASVALQIQAVPMFLAGPFAREVTSIFASSGDRAAAEYAVRFQRAWVPVTGIFLSVASSASWFVVFGWLGAKSSAAGGIAAVLLVGYLVNLWTLPMSGTALAVGKAGVEARYGVVAAVVNVALTVPGAAIFGVWGIAAGTALGQIIGSLYLIRVYRGAVGPCPESFLGIAPYREMLVVAAGVSAVGLVAMMSGLGRASLLVVVLSASVLALAGGLAIRRRSLFATGTHGAGAVAPFFEESAVA
jgi:O-antigen/teichoic acid export membrane protein